jgi:hypothetical protein
MSQFATRSILREDLDEIVALARNSIGADRSAAYYRWKYFDNPAGQPRGQCAYNEERLLGLNVAVPVPLQAKSELYPAAQMVDAMVLPSMRQLGMFTVLFEETLREVFNDQVALAFGFPAPIALKTATSKFGWMHLLDVPRYVRVLDTRKVAGAMSNPAKRVFYRLWLEAIYLYAQVRMRKTKQTDLKIVQVEAFDARFDDLWSRVSSKLEFAFPRTSSYLQWRYAAHPEKLYTCLGAFSSDVLVAYIIAVATEANGIKTWEIVEFLVDPAMPSAGTALLLHLCDIAKLEGASQLTTWMLPHHPHYTDALVAAGFMYTQSQLAPRRFRYAAPFTVRLHPQITLPVSPFQAENWYLSMGDSDLH